MRKGSAAFDAAGWSAEQEQMIRALMQVLRLDVCNSQDVTAVGAVVERMTKRS